MASYVSVPQSQTLYRKSLREIIPPWNTDMLRKKIEYDLSNYVLPIHHMTNVIKLDGTFYKRLECKNESSESINLADIVIDADVILFTCENVDIVERIDVKRTFGRSKLTMENIFQRSRNYFYSVESAKEENMKYLTYGLVNVSIISGYIVILRVEEVFDIHECDPESYYIKLVHKTRA